MTTPTLDSHLLPPPPLEAPPAPPAPAPSTVDPQRARGRYTGLLLAGAVAAALLAGCVGWSLSNLRAASSWQERAGELSATLEATTTRLSEAERDAADLTGRMAAAEDEQVALLEEVDDLVEENRTLSADRAELVDTVDAAEMLVGELSRCTASAVMVARQVPGAPSLEAMQQDCLIAAELFEDFERRADRFVV